MINMLLIMHHIVLCTSCIALFNCGHLLHIRINQAEQVQLVFGGPQASCGEDTNLALIKASPSASNHLP
jgi:hypothetical protein